MDYAQTAGKILEKADSDNSENEMRPLSDLQLILIGGGTGEVIIG